MKEFVTEKRDLKKSVFILILISYPVKESSKPNAHYSCKTKKAERCSAFFIKLKSSYCFAVNSTRLLFARDKASFSSEIGLDSPKA